MEALPTEVLVDYILCYLSLPDICNCRLVSRRLNDVGRSRLGRSWPLTEIHSEEVGLKFLSIFGHCSYNWQLDLKPLKLSLDTIRKISDIFGPTVREYRLHFDATPSHLPLLIPVQRGILSILLEESAAPQLETLVILSAELYTELSEHRGLFNFPRLRTLKLGHILDGYGECCMHSSAGSEFLARNLLRSAPRLRQLCLVETPGCHHDDRMLETVQEMGLGNTTVVSYIPNVYAHIPRSLLPISPSIQRLRLNIRNLVIKRAGRRSRPRIPVDADLQRILTPLETFQLLDSTAPNLTFLQIRIAGSLRPGFQFPVFPRLEILILDEGDHFRGHSPVTSTNFPQLCKIMFIRNALGISDFLQGTFPSVQEVHTIDEDGAFPCNEFPKFLRQKFPNARKLHLDSLVGTIAWT